MIFMRYIITSFLTNYVYDQRTKQIELARVEQLRPLSRNKQVYGDYAAGSLLVSIIFFDWWKTTGGLNGVGGADSS